MDLLFKRYASPFLLLDEMISNCELSTFVEKIVEKTNKEEAYEVWLHRVFGKTFKDFYDECLKEAKNTTMTVNVEEIVKKSTNVLNIIQPQEGVE